MMSLDDKYEKLLSKLDKIDKDNESIKTRLVDSSANLGKKLCKIDGNWKKETGKLRKNMKKQRKKETILKEKRRNFIEEWRRQRRTEQKNRKQEACREIWNEI